MHYKYIYKKLLLKYCNKDKVKIFKIGAAKIPGCILHTKDILNWKAANKI